LNRITALFQIQYPIIQAGMIWCSGWELASAVSQAGGLGLIGAGSMYPEVLRRHIRKCQAATTQPFGVNVPLLYPQVSQLMQVILEEQVPIVFTSAGNPQTWTARLQQAGIKVAHVVSNVKFARKSAEAGVDALVAEGFEAGGHNGREETTTFCLIPLVRQAVDLPLIAAGGIGNGRGLFGALALGAEGVQVGSRFAASEESSAHLHFKESILAAREGDTQLSLKQLTPVRLLKNKFYEEIAAAERRGAGPEELASLLGSRRAKKGMFEGDLDNGELEIGQVAALIEKIMPAGDIVRQMWQEFGAARRGFYQDYPAV
jgi:enoyl-[acyl-carrier protein] reductase II